MKGKIFVFVLILLVGFVIFGIDAHAEDNITYSGTLTQSYIESGITYDNVYSFSSAKRFCMYVLNNSYYLVAGESSVMETWNNKKTYSNGNPPSISTGTVTYPINKYQYFTIVKDGDYVTIPLFASYADAGNYIVNGDTTTQTNKPYDMLTDDMPVDIDMSNTSTYLTDYKLKGFSSDYEINAKWTGVQYPVSMQQYFNNGSMELLDEKIYISLSYCDKSYPTQVAYTKWIPTGVSPSALSCSFDIDDYKSTDSEYYLFSVGFYPCMQYKTKVGMGTSSQVTTWSYGSKNMVYFNYDNVNDKIDGSKISVDTGNQNNDTDTDLVWSDDENIMVTDLDSAMKKFVNLIESVSATGQKIAQAFSIFYGFLPIWLTGAISGIIMVCVILRIVGR